VLDTTRSQEIFTAAQKLMPGGVSSPVRAFKSVGGQPIVFERVKGAYAWDVDGNRYIDYVGSWGPAICGHSHPEVIAALRAALEKGTSFGAPCELENQLAEMVSRGRALGGDGALRELRHRGLHGGAAPDAGLSPAARS
jgi:Glutamate-1-semialdehyde aminotransferase